MKATFVLPGAATLPSGGSRMVLRYASALANSGWAVTVLMPAGAGEAPWWRQLSRSLRYWRLKRTGGYAPRAWQKVGPGVTLQWERDLRASTAPAADVVIATAVRTAEAVACWPPEAGRKFYFVQGYETWDHPESRVQASWRLPLTKIAISRWLCGLIAAVGETAEHVPNGVDRQAFGLDRKIEQRGPVVLWPHHRLALKGSSDALAAVAALADRVPGLTLHAYGTALSPRHPGLKIAYERNPSPPVLRALYNQAAVTIAPSHSEGWGLPPCEALQCGAAVAASDVGGHREFLRQGQNALLHRPGDVEALRRNVLTLLQDEELRLRLVRQGLADVNALSFEASVDRLQNVLRGKECE